MIQCWAGWRDISSQVVRKYGKNLAIVFTDKFIKNNGQIKYSDYKYINK